MHSVFLDFNRNVINYGLGLGILGSDLAIKNQKGHDELEANGIFSLIGPREVLLFPAAAL